MLKDSEAFSSFSVNDIAAAKQFYTETLGLECGDGPMGILELKLATGGHIMIYPKDEGHSPASFTILNFPVKDMEVAVDELTGKGVTFLQYDNEMIKTDAKGIARNDEFGPPMAWFTDPAGNIMALMQL